MTMTITTPPQEPSSMDIPDRLSVDPKSAFYNGEVFKREIGIRFNGVEKNNVEEYCISEGWVRIPASKTLDRKGQPLLMKFKGKVEAYFKD